MVIRQNQKTDKNDALAIVQAILRLREQLYQAEKYQAENSAEKSIGWLTQRI
ncbi:hypothetical protein [Vibrio spartinae]|uniref:hypothetical protein n=1 Tax=Vibrio spartinae TaxID=1918945 RepID=UPI0013563A5C|nr:hypothetical protein [Vibrio spartinae]